MMVSFVRLQLGLLAVICAAHFAYSCSCARTHPQQGLCSDQTFAALVRVRSAEFVYITERPRTRNTTEEITSQNISDLNKRVDGRDANKDFERIEVVVKQKDLYKLLHTNFVVSYIRYRVKIYETFNGLKPEEVSGKKVYVYTAPYESLCGITLKEKETYLLIGSIADDRKLRIGLCNYHLHWNAVEIKQRRAIRKNMRAATETCQSGCSVQFCDPNWMSCEKSKNTCLWTAQMVRTNYKLNVDPAAYVCKRELEKQGASCTWTDGLRESKRVRRRRRRNHTSGLIRRLESRHANP